MSKPTLKEKMDNKFIAITHKQGVNVGIDLLGNYLVHIAKGDKNKRALRAVVSTVKSNFENEILRREKEAIENAKRN